MNENMADEARLTDQLAQLTTRLEMLQQSLETQSKQQHASIQCRIESIILCYGQTGYEKITGLK